MIVAIVIMIMDINIKVCHHIIAFIESFFQISNNIRDKILLIFLSSWLLLDILYNCKKSDASVGSGGLFFFFLF